MSFQFLSMISAMNWATELFKGVMAVLQEVLAGFIFGFLIYFLFIGTAYIINFAQELFNKVSGITEMSINDVPYGGKSTNGDLIIGIIKNDLVQKSFFTIIAVCLVLLVVFTIVAVIKTEFSMKYVSKAPIITRALTSMANFFMIPILFIVGIYATNTLIKVVNDSMSKAANASMATKCFMVGSAGANRARNSLDFANYLKRGEWLILTDREKNPFKNLDQAAIANLIDDYFEASEDGQKLSKVLTGTFNETTGLYENGLTMKHYNYSQRADKLEADESDVTNSVYIDWQTSMMGYPDFKEGISYLNITMVNYFYDFSSFNYILALGSAVVIAWSMLSVCLMLIKRIFEMLLLFMLSPVMTAVAPLDGGNAEKKVRGEFLKRLLSVIGPIFAYSLFFIIVKIISNMSPFSGESTIMFGQLIKKVFLSMFDYMFQIAAIIVGLGLLKTANTMFTSMLGLEDMLGAADANMKKTMGTAGKVALGATAMAGLTFKAAGTAAKLGGKGVSGIGKFVGGKKDMLKQSKIDNKKESIGKELAQEEGFRKNAFEQGDAEAVNISDQRISELKGEMANVEASDAKLAKKKIKRDEKPKFYKSKHNGETSEVGAENVAADGEDKTSDDEPKMSLKEKNRAQRKERFDASIIGRKFKDFKKGNFPLPLKDIYGASTSTMLSRLSESMSGLSNESGQAAMKLFNPFNKDERKTFYKSKDEISADKEKEGKEKKENVSGKEAELDMLKKIVAKEQSPQIEKKLKELNEAVEDANKDGILSEQIAAKKKLENFEVKNGITKQAEIMQASINKVSDKGHFDNLDKLNTFLDAAREEAKTKGTEEAKKQLGDQEASNEKVFKNSLSGLEGKMEELLKAFKHDDTSANQKVFEEAQSKKMDDLIRNLDKGFSSLGDVFKEVFNKNEDGKK